MVLWIIGLGSCSSLVDPIGPLHSAWLCDFKKWQKKPHELFMYCGTCWVSPSLGISITNCHVGEWSSCIESDVSPFLLSYAEMSEYCHHQRWFSNLGKHRHCQFDSYRFGATCFDDDNTCNNDCCLKQNTILHRANAKRWFHYPCHRKLWLSMFSFWFIFYFLCTC